MKDLIDEVDNKADDYSDKIDLFEDRLNLVIKIIEIKKFFHDNVDKSTSTLSN